MNNINTFEENGVLYKIEYQPSLSNYDYTQHKVFHIKTAEEHYPTAKKAIVTKMKEILGQDPWSKGIWEIRRKKDAFNYFHSYYTFTYDTEIDAFVYILVTPYDD